MIGGDWNAHVGANEEKPVCGKFGLRESNEQGRDWINWLAENDLTYVNSYYCHKSRGTWFSQIHRRWYELDGFVMTNRQRHKHTVKVKTIQEYTISDHKPKKLEIKHTKTKRRKQERTKRNTNIQHEKLKDEEAAMNFRQKVEAETEKWIDERGWTEPEETWWGRLTDITTSAAREICGEREKKIENPWMIGRDDEIMRMRRRIQTAIDKRNKAREERNDDDLNIARKEVTEARKELRNNTRKWEKDWWEELIEKCREAGEKNDQGSMYRLLKQIGLRNFKKAPETTTITKEEFKEQFSSVSKDRFERKPEEIFAAVDRAPDLRDSELHRKWGYIMSDPPEYEEIYGQMKLMKDSAPGKDGVRLNYIMKGGDLIKSEVVNLVKFMFKTPADRWEKDLKTGQVIPLFKKGDKNNPGNYRGICLLSMGSRILARVMANRLRIWAEKMQLVDDNQAGFRKNRSTADVTQIMVRIHEDTTDLYKRKAATGVQMEEDEKPMAVLLDLRKAYPRVNKPALWRLLERYGLEGDALRVLQDLHETTTYTVRSREGDSEPWTPERGLREGCPSSPPLFNIYHQAVMRDASDTREKIASENNTESGISIKWVRGNNFPSESLWEKMNSEAERRKINLALFADDTSGVGKKGELRKGMEAIKNVMYQYEEANNEDKEEIVMFGCTEGENIRILGSYLGNKEDTKQRIKRGGTTWAKLKNRMKKSKMSKKIQARVIEACVESTMLFDCHVRTWRKGEIKKLQSFADKCYRHIWAKKNMAPLREMQAKHVNMQDIRTELGIKSLDSKIEKRVLERIGHIMRMDDDRLVKATTLGWIEELENIDKVPGKKNKTVTYWRNKIRNAGLDPTKIGDLTKDRKEWKTTVKSRIEHILAYDESKGNKYEGEPRTRNIKRTKREDDLICRQCNKACKSKGGLTNHIRLMHEREGKKVFKCEKCEEVFPRDANLRNHRQACSGITTSEGTSRICGCGSSISKSNWARHKKRCAQNEIENQEEATTRKYKPGWKNCENCGKPISKTNMSRHLKTCRRSRE